MSKNYLNEAEILELTRVRLENSEKQATIAQILAEYDYGPKKIAEGRTIRSKAEEAYNFKRQENLETSEAHNKFINLQEIIGSHYKRDRKTGKAVFAENPDILNRLSLTGSIPESYVKWLETVKIFYTESMADEAVQKSLTKLKVTREHCTEILAHITDMETTRVDYLREKGESQEATALKDNAFAALDDWMRKFKAIAQIAFENHPQLLEALGIKA